MSINRPIMPLEQPNSLPDIAWYLVARDGDVAVRVQPGMVLGEDSSGDLSFEAEDALVELEITDDGQLELKVSGERNELQIPGQASDRCVYLSHQIPGRLSFFDQTLSISTDFTKAAASGEIVEIRVVSNVPAPTTIARLAERDKQADDGLSSTGLIIVPETILAQSPAATIINFSREYVRRSLSGSPVNPIAAGAAIVSALIIAGIYVALQDSAFALQGTASSTPTRQLEPKSEPLVEIQLADGYQARKNPVLVNISALLDFEQLPNEATINFALSSLKALRSAYPDDPQVRQGLSSLTQRLTQEAQLSYDQGNDDLAQRLIDQASTSGVDQDLVERTVRHVSVPRTVSPTVAPPTKAPPTIAPPTKAAPNMAAPTQQTATQPLRASTVGTSARAPGADQADINPIDPIIDSKEEDQPADPTTHVSPDVVVSLRDLDVAIGQLTASLAPADAAPDPQPLVLPTLEPIVTFTADPPKPIDRRIYRMAELVAIRRVAPAYPRIAPAGAEGSVDIEMTVTETGVVQDIDIIGDPPRYFVRPARQAVRKWKFEPVIENGKRVPVRTAVRLTFRS
jgi:TonB family protein